MQAVLQPIVKATLLNLPTGPQIPSGHVQGLQLPLANLLVATLQRLMSWILSWQLSRQKFLPSSWQTGLRLMQ